MTTFLAIHLNARLRPLDRGEWLEDPLQEVLAARSPGSEVSGGGTLISAEGEPESCDIDIELEGDPATGLALVIDALQAFGAPRGSTARLGDADSLPFGLSEGLGLYLNGTDLPAEVYVDNDVNDLISRLDELLGEEGAMRSYWEGPRDTALYLYGDSAARMRELLADLLATHPLARDHRLVTLA